MKIILFQNKIPKYRSKFFENLFLAKNISFHVAVNENYFNSCNKFSFVGLKGARLKFIKCNIILRILKKEYSSVILPGPDFSIINLTIIHLICLLRGVKIIYWTQGQNKSKIAYFVSVLFLLVINWFTVKIAKLKKPFSKNAYIGNRLDMII